MEVFIALEAYESQHPRAKVTYVRVRPVSSQPQASTNLFTVSETPGDLHTRTVSGISLITVLATQATGDLKAVL